MNGIQKRAFLAAFLVGALSLPLLAQDYKSDPRALIRHAIENESKQEAAKHYFMSRDVKKKKNGDVETREMVETPQVILARLVALNGQALNEDQKKKEDARLNRLINSPDELAKKKKEQHDDDQRVRRMVAAIPDAFNFEYVGTEPTPGGEIVTLKFQPNPNWDPPSRELSVYTGMQGVVKVAVPQYRLALMQAQLFKDVDFGWGILGHLDKGGDFMIQQGDVYNGHWDLTHMKLHFTGKVLVFKSLNIQQDETMSDFRPVPEMNVAQALDRLKQADTEYAKNANGGSGK